MIQRMPVATFRLPWSSLDVATLHRLSVLLPLVSLAADQSIAQTDSPDSDPIPSVTLLDTVRPLPPDPVNVLQSGDPNWSARGGGRRLSTIFSETQ